MFDSGVGGLTVLHECLVSLPEEDYVYLGDTALFPYGDKDTAQLRARIGAISALLLQDAARPTPLLDLLHRMDDGTLLLLQLALPSEIPGYVLAGVVKLTVLQEGKEGAGIGWTVTGL